MRSGRLGKQRSCGELFFEEVTEAAPDGLCERGRHRVANLSPLYAWRAAEYVIVRKRLQPRRLARSYRTRLRRMDVAVPILRKVRDDRFAGLIGPETRVFIVE